MAQCSFHPRVETNVRCSDCDRYICQEDMVATAVGYKCPECGLVGEARNRTGLAAGVKAAVARLSEVKFRGAAKAEAPELGEKITVRQVLLGMFAGLLAALVLAPLTATARGWMSGAPYWLVIVVIYGALVGEATRRGAGGHRTWEFAIIAAACAAIGAGVAGLIMGEAFHPALATMGPMLAGVYVYTSHHVAVGARS